VLELLNVYFMKFDILTVVKIVLVLWVVMLMQIRGSARCFREENFKVNMWS
jgi:hypothetical protein